MQQQQNQTNQRINAGTNQINAIFDGGTYGTNPVTSWSPQTFVGVPGSVSNFGSDMGGALTNQGISSFMAMPTPETALGLGLDATLGSDLVGGGNQTNWEPLQWFGGRQHPAGLPQVTRNVPVAFGTTYYDSQGIS